MDEQIKQYLIAASFLIGGLALGVLVEKTVLSRLKKIALKTTWEGDDLLIDSFKGIIIFWGIIAGMHLGIEYMPGNEFIKSIAWKISFTLTGIAITVVSSRILVGLIKLKTKSSSGVIPSTSIISNITKVVIFLIGGMVILQTLGISVTPMLTALGVGGLAVALALQEPLSNLFAGMQIIASQQTKIGDYIKIDATVEGYIVDITWRSTTIRALANNIIIVPNAKLASAIVINYQMPNTEVPVKIDVGVSYNSDLAKVEEVAIQTATEIMNTIEGGVKEFIPAVRFHTFAESSINFTVVMMAQQFENQYLIKHEFVKALHKSFKANNINIPFPIRTVYLKQDK